MAGRPPSHIIIVPPAGVAGALVAREDARMAAAPAEGAGVAAAPAGTVTLATEETGAVVVREDAGAARQDVAETVAGAAGPS